MIYSDPANGFSFSTKKVNPVTIIGNHAQFSGTAKIGRQKLTFTVNATDNGNPGSADIFSINLSNGYSASGHLTSGNIWFQ